MLFNEMSVKMPLQSPVVVLANGQFPSHPVPLQHLMMAETLICTDGSYHYLAERGLEPTCIIGDMDSIDSSQVTAPHCLLTVDNQNNTDMAKALDWCIEQQIKQATLLGCTGLREDHHLANLLLMAQYHEHLSLQIITNHCVITCIKGTHSLESHPGQVISLIALQDSPRITTHHLQYPLCNESLRDASHGISNISTANNITLTTDKLLFVFQQHPEK